MALTLSLREEQTFYVGDKEVVLKRIESPNHAVLQSENGEFDVTDDRMVEVLKDMYVCIGLGGHPGTVRLAIEAPRNIPIGTRNPKEL